MDNPEKSCRLRDFPRRISIRSQKANGKKLFLNLLKKIMWEL